MRSQRRVVPCCGVDCANDASNLKCPTCAKMGLPDHFFCSQPCFKSSWSVHKAVHSQQFHHQQQHEESVLAEVDTGHSTEDDAFDQVGEKQRIAVSATPEKKAASVFELFGLESQGSPTTTPPKSPRRSGGSTSTSTSNNNVTNNGKQRKPPRTLQTMISLDDLALLAQSDNGDQSSTDDSSISKKTRKSGSYTQRGKRRNKISKKEKQKRSQTLGRSATRKGQKFGSMSRSSSRKKSLFSPREKLRKYKDEDDKRSVSMLDLGTIPTYEDEEDHAKTARVADVAAQLDVGDIFATDEIETLASKLVLDIFDEDVLNVVNEEKEAQAQAQQDEEDLTELTSGESGEEEDSFESYEEEEDEATLTEEEEPEQEPEVKVDQTGTIVEPASTENDGVALVGSDSTEMKIKQAPKLGRARAESKANGSQVVGDDTVTPRELQHMARYLEDNSHNTSEVGQAMLSAVIVQQEDTTKPTTDNGGGAPQQYPASADVDEDADDHHGVEKMLDDMFEMTPENSDEDHGGQKQDEDKEFEQALDEMMVVDEPPVKELESKGADVFSPRADELLDAMFDVEEVGEAAQPAGDKSAANVFSPRADEMIDAMFDVPAGDLVPQSDAAELRGEEPQDEEPQERHPDETIESGSSHEETEQLVGGEEIDSGVSEDSDELNEEEEEEEDEGESAAVPAITLSATANKPEFSGFSPRQLEHMQKIAAQATSPRDADSEEEPPSTREDSDERPNQRNALVLLSPRGAPDDAAPQTPSHAIVVDGDSLKERQEEISELITLVSEVPVKASPTTPPATTKASKPSPARRLKSKRKGRGSKRKRPSKKRSPKRIGRKARAQPKQSPVRVKLDQQEPVESISASGPLKLPGTGPIAMDLSDDQAKMICRCGQSATFPLCDGTHVTYNQSNGTNYSPFTASQQELGQDTVYICGCGQSKNRSNGVPFCDGSHTKLDVKVETTPPRPTEKGGKEEGDAEQHHGVICSGCAHVISKGKRFCGACGMDSLQKCQHCNGVLQRNAKSCVTCGKPVEEETKTAEEEEAKKPSISPSKARKARTLRGKKGKIRKGSAPQSRQNRSKSVGVVAPITKEKPSPMSGGISPRVPTVAPSNKSRPRTKKKANRRKPKGSKKGPRAKSKRKGKVKGKGRTKGKSKKKTSIPAKPASAEEPSALEAGDKKSSETPEPSKSPLPGNSRKPRPKAKRATKGKRGRTLRRKKSSVEGKTRPKKKEAIID